MSNIIPSGPVVGGDAPVITSVGGTDVDPSAPEHAAPTTTAHKAVWGTVVAFVIAVLGGVQLALASGADLGNWAVWLNIVIVALVGGGGTGGAVYAVANKTKA